MLGPWVRELDPTSRVAKRRKKEKKRHRRTHGCVMAGVASGDGKRWALGWEERGGERSSSGWESSHMGLWLVSALADEEGFERRQGPG